MGWLIKEGISLGLIVYTAIACRIPVIGLTGVKRSLLPRIP